MTLTATITAALAAAGVLGHVVRVAIRGWRLFRKQPSPIHQATTITEEKPTMSETTTTVTATVTVPNHAASIFDTIHVWASKAVEAMTLVGTEWTAIKANPLYGALAVAAVDAAKAELAAKGIPTDGVVNVGNAIRGMLDVLAAAHPVIVTPA